MAFQVNLVKYFEYFINLRVLSVLFQNLFGFVLLLTFVLQYISGIMLIFSFSPEIMLVTTSRDSEDQDDLITDDFFWLHERCVDVIFIYVYIHFLRKLYLLNIFLNQEFAWKSGCFILIWLQIVTFFGLVLCSTHLSDITLKIAANCLELITNYKYQIYWWCFTDKDLNTDTLLRCYFLHYFTAFFLIICILSHNIVMHYDWTPNYNFNGVENQLNWYNEVIIYEIKIFLYAIFLVFLIYMYIYSEIEASSYELFMWGDVGMIVDINFVQVAPHWYFRPLMSFLLVFPHTYGGIFGLVWFFIILYLQPNLMYLNENNKYNVISKNINGINHFSVKVNYCLKLNINYSFFVKLNFFIFVFCLLYITTYLPCGKYYQEFGGNFSTLFAFFYIFAFLVFSEFRFCRLLFKLDLNKKLRTIFFKKC